MGKLKPVKIDGLEFDALITLDESYTSDVPTYPVEDGTEVSDTIINKQIEIPMSLIISNTPVTWSNRKGHEPGNDRAEKYTRKVIDLWKSRKIIKKVVTKDKVFKNCVINTLKISKGKGERQIDITLKVLAITKNKTVHIPDAYVLAGISMEDVGSASTDEVKSSDVSSSGNDSGSSNVDTDSSSSDTNAGDVISNTLDSMRSATSKKSGSVLYNLLNR